ncbi:DNA-binding transcriptional regulator, PucR family [Nocardioides exalbidus]|uniref:DNA-binding transcriptional regulator, PucR family n=1 Tax=Nocardioides exalbidus TaxID=402596 RepID=A0A1H4W229_9ACTN|nr:PucR family transcriptional regulator [Nocardioides exalbidus]SEC87366.1 DNA-binding transcriptional regulator, PucR family [Nocardioides exalbidus]
MPPSRRRAADALRNSTGALSTAATGRMSSDLPWFDDLSAQDRSWVGLIVQAGIRGFVDWYDREVEALSHDPLDVVVFGAAPRELTGVISLQQTVELVRLSIRVVETTIDDLLDPEDAGEVHGAVLLYAREVAFATAAVYARAAESRGAWDARLEALVVDAVVRAETDESVLSRASALGWGAHGDVAVVLGSVPPHRAELDVFESVRRSARLVDMDALCATQGDRLVVVLGGVADPLKAATHLIDHFGDGPVVVGPVTADLAHAYTSARDALSAHRAASGWPDAPRPVASRDLLPERALAGDGHARRHLVDEVYLPLVAARGTLLETLAAWFEHGSSIEATARALFVHPNTVRYRLRQVSDATGWSPTRPREAFALQLALILGRQSGRTEP